MIIRIFLVKFLATDFIDSTNTDSFDETTYRFCQLPMHFKFNKSRNI